MCHETLAHCRWIPILIIINNIFNHSWFSNQLRINFTIIIDVHTRPNSSGNLRLLPFDKTMNSCFWVWARICDWSDRSYFLVWTAVHCFIRHFTKTISGCLSSEAQICFLMCECIFFCVNLLFGYWSTFYYLILILISDNYHWQKSLLDRFWMLSTTNQIVKAFHFFLSIRLIWKHLILILNNFCRFFENLFHSIHENGVHWTSMILAAFLIFLYFVSPTITL